MIDRVIRDDNLALILAPAALQERHKAVKAMYRARMRRILSCGALIAASGGVYAVLPAQWSLVSLLVVCVLMPVWTAIHDVFDGMEIRRAKAQIAELEALMRRYNRLPPTI